MPNPNEYDDEESWMKVCVPKMIGEGKEQDQAVAACMSMWKDKGKEKEKEQQTDFIFAELSSSDLKYIDGLDKTGIFFDNGGRATLKSYKKNCGEFRVPDEHLKFYRNLKSSFEGADFISVHAGFNPKVYNMEQQTEDDILWIRESFYRSERRWEKTVIFGHTPTGILGKRHGEVYFDDKKNIIGIDTGAVYGGVLTCLRWPDRKIFQS